MLNVISVISLYRRSGFHCINLKLFVGLLKWDVFSLDLKMPKSLARISIGNTFRSTGMEKEKEKRK